MHSLVLTLFLVFQAPSAGQAAPEPHPLGPELEAVYDAAIAALNAKKPDDAAPHVKRLEDEAPDNPRVDRLMGLHHSALGDKEWAEKHFRDALEHGVAGRWKADVLNRLAGFELERERLPEAEKLLTEALSVEPNHVRALENLAFVALIQGRLERARDLYHRVLELTPEGTDPHPHLMLASTLTQLEEPDAALESLERAYALGLEPEDLSKRVEKVSRKLQWRRRLWQWPLGMALFLGLGLLLSWGAGHALSSMQLGQLRADDLHLLRAEQTSRERWVDRLYAAVLWFASLLFYVSIPMMLVLTVAIAGGLVLLIAMMPVIPVKLLLIVGFVGLGGLFAILRGVFSGSEPPEEGRLLRPEEAPALFDALEEVAEVARSRKVDRVLLDAGTGIGVREAGGRLNVLFGRGERILHLGMGALRGLTVTELKSILAHEYGHFSHGETRLTPIIGRIQTQVLQVVQSIAEMGGGAFNPVGWYLRAYFFVYLRITAGHGRRRELLADRVSALAYGGDTFGSALSKAVESSATYDRGRLVAARLRQAGRPARDLFRTLDSVERNTPPVLQSLIREELFSRPVDAYDSHPPPSERIERVKGLPGQRPVEAEPALTLFEAPEQLSAELGTKVLEDLDANLELDGYEAPPTVATTDDEQERLASAIALQTSALDLGERNHADAYRLLQESLWHLERTAGADDPYLVPTLVELSRLHLDHEAPEDARQALQRAIDIVQAQPDHPRQQVDALRELLSQVPEQHAA
ncbi:tetratricopeptide repeat protein [Myxococcus sp. K15C18031901]|uniref:tetratricopeptide repeat protein n=1 Tax=Myxococcus dinghuensis TaxID=2906761 RepID=UPI0020A81317|nr:tetratricopeptide repeat protein [Myxococcus dinghuensis]MCP3097489.1 tetratricopeptide repeat protein [Myxococcus dinghuensis]